MMKWVAGILVIGFSLAAIGCNKDEATSGTDDLQKQLAEAAKKNEGKPKPAMKERMGKPSPDEMKTKAGEAKPTGASGPQ